MPVAVRQLKSTPALPIPAVALPVDPLLELPEFARVEAQRRLAIIRPAITRVQQGVSVRAAAAWLHSAALQMPSVSSLQRWLRDYLRGGIVELAPRYQGRQRKVRGWEARAAEIYASPNRPTYATVAFWLQQEGFHGVNKKAVERYLKALPSHLGDGSRSRLGAHYYAQNVKPHVVRDNTVLAVGMVYEADGHCCDVYVAHPATGRPFRPELTVWIDVRSHYVVGWWLSVSESAETTLFSLSHALIAHDHVPDFVHTDPGSGFKNRLICDETTGFLERLGIQPMFALPGNAKGKGLTEGWFRWFEERCGKRFATYCGHDRTDDFLRHLTVKVGRGEIKLPALAEYLDAVRAYIGTYNRNAKPALGGQSPEQVWSGLERNPVMTAAEALIRPRTTRTVQRWGVKLDGRAYRAAELQAYEGREVIVEYSIHDDVHVWIVDKQGRHVAVATLVEKNPWLPASRIEEATERRLKNQTKRHLAHIAEQEARARVPISAAQVVEALEAPTQSLAPAPVPALTQGHSLTMPPVQIAPVIPRAPDAQELHLVRQVITEQQAEAEAESPEQRYGRWLELDRAIRADEPVPPSSLQWFHSYSQSSEHAGLADIHQSFGYVLGVPASRNQEQNP
jgi:putative transposase